MKTIITLLLLFSTSIYAADAYLCIEEQAAGFGFNKKTKEWRAMTFKASSKYTVKKRKNSLWTVTHHGSKDMILECKNGFSKYGYLKCNRYSISFSMSKTSLRFQYEYPIGYAISRNVIDEGIQEGQDSPYISIGMCSAL